MLCSQRLFVLAALLAAPVTYLSAQAGPANQDAAKPKPSVQTQRAERTGEFLGLGPAPDAKAAAAGKILFTSNCAFCHGANATGAEGPDLVRSALVLHDEKGNLIGAVVHNGRPDKGMPSFASFTPEQLYDLAEFLHQRVYDSANRGVYQVQNVVTGNAQAGEAYFNGAGRCNTCHSPTGDLAHVASKFQPVDLQAAFLYPASVNRFGPGSEKEGFTKQVTVTLPSGQSVTGPLKRQDDFNISIYDSTGTYHSWPRDQVKVEVKDPLAAHAELLAQYTDADMHNLLAYLVTLK